MCVGQDLFRCCGLDRQTPPEAHMWDWQSPQEVLKSLGSHFRGDYEIETPLPFDFLAKRTP